jgi:uncharacterized protein (DUF433 family)
MIEAPVALVPLSKSEHGVWVVNGTRVPLETIIASFTDGATAEEIVLRYPTLKLADTYAVLAHYLQNRDEVDCYLNERALAAEAIQTKWEQRTGDYAELRARLLARRQS